MVEPQYKDRDGNPTPLHQLCAEDPQWAASRIAALRTERNALLDQSAQVPDWIVRVAPFNRGDDGQATALRLSARTYGSEEAVRSAVGVLIDSAWEVIDVRTGVTTVRVMDNVEEGTDGDDGS